MPALIGEFECKIDAKGRLRLPAALLKQLQGFGGDGECIINRGMDAYLTLYPKSVWEFESAKVDQLSDFDEYTNKFKRYFYRGTSLVSPDSADRILLSKNLIEHAGIKKTVILQAMKKKVEIWSKENHEKMVSEEPKKFPPMTSPNFGGAPNFGNPPNFNQGYNNPNMGQQQNPNIGFYHTPNQGMQQNPNIGFNQYPPGMNPNQYPNPIPQNNPQQGTTETPNPDNELS